MRTLRAAAVSAAIVTGWGTLGVAADGAVSGPTELAIVGGEQDWGVQTDIVATYTAPDFDLFMGTEGPMNTGTGGRACASGRCGWFVGLQLPSGAQVRSLELSACDGTPTGDVSFALFRGAAGVGGLTSIGTFATTGESATPGCSTFTSTLSTPHTIQNGTHGYLLDVLADTGSSIQWTQLRVRYRLQVSAGPAVATFTDVPTTHGFFRFIEAMHAAGIISGCGGGNFCPNEYVNRGQLSVFLSVALGLHFPN